MRSYEAARFYFSCLSFGSWCIIVVGLIVALGGLGAGSQFGGRGSGMVALAGAVPGLIAMFLGFMGLVLAQIGRAGVDSAEYGQQMLKIARDQLDVSKQALKQGEGLERGFAALTSAAQSTRTDEQAKPTEAPTSGYAAAFPTGATAQHKVGERFVYRGQKILVTEDGYSVLGGMYGSLNEARSRVEQFAAGAQPPLKGPKPYASQLGVNKNFQPPRDEG